MVGESPDLEAVFYEARRRDAKDRSAYLDEVCGRDLALRQRLEQFLSAQAEIGDFLEAPAPELNSLLDERPLEQPGATIGPYKLLEQIGEGGMGLVFMAEQKEPVRRKVALKLIKPGMDSKQVIARFEAERQALAMMDHPNIAKVLEAGTTDAGRPYFVMELVHGIAITDYCDQAKFTIRQRLKLFVKVCRAVQHAHTKGIIHRDLKPGNVLVTSNDVKAVPKIIDFGVAKALGPSLTEQTLHTGFAQMIGTPLYMSPEQAEFNQAGVDTRSDIYSLGVLLYELLTGTTPFEAERLKQVGFDEMRRLIREEEPRPPSARVSTLGAKLETVSEQRSAQPRTLCAALRGDLDWIILKALDKDRGRRYETASEFAADIERCLNDEPVAACPPSAAYRVRKLARRNKGALIAGSLVIASLLLGTGISLWQAIEATSARELSVERLGKETQARIDEEKAKQIAEGRREQAQAIARLLESVFHSLNPRSEVKDSADLKARLIAALDSAVEQLERDSDSVDAEDKARLQNILANAFGAVGEHKKAIVQYERSLATSKEKRGADHQGTLVIMENLAVIYTQRGNLKSAIPLLEQTLKTRQSKLGPDHEDTLGSMHYLAAAYRLAGKLKLAIPLFEETFAKRKASLGPNHAETLQTMNSLAVAYDDAGRSAMALPLYKEALERLTENLGPDHHQTILTMGNLADAYRQSNRLDLALPLLEQTVQKSKATNSADHPNTLVYMSFLGRAYLQAGKLDLAVPLLEQTWEKQKQKAGVFHGNTLLTMRALALAYERSDSLEKADQILQTLIKRALAQKNRSLSTIELLTVHALVRIKQKRYAEADENLRTAISICELGFPDAWHRFHASSLLGAVFLAQQKYAEAEPLLVYGHDGMQERAAKAPDILGQSSLTDAIARLVQLYEATNRPDKAKVWRAKLGRAEEQK
jgi:serine/threonine protein kinase/tetratricopeptide (TPR) repeat protein